jgi:hypothetical protein
MTVAELIAALQAFPADMRVVLPSGDTTEPWADEVASVRPLPIQVNRERTSHRVERPYPRCLYEEDDEPFEPNEIAMVIDPLAKGARDLGLTSGE